MSSPNASGPGIFSIVFGAIFSLVLGAVLATVHLIARPVEVVDAAVKEPEAGKLYFVQGATGGGGWQRKSDLLKAPGGAAAFTESDLNGWSAQTFAPPKKEKEEKPAELITPGLPNFRFDGEELQVGVVSQLEVSGVKYALVLQAKGGFERGGEGWRFVPSQLYLNSLPLHKVPGAASALLAKLGGAGAMPPEVATVFARATKLGVAGGTLTVSMP